MPVSIQYSDIVRYTFCPMYQYHYENSDRKSQYTDCLRNAAISFLISLARGNELTISDLRDMFTASFNRLILPNVDADEADELLKRAVSDTDRFYTSIGSKLNKDLITNVNYSYKIDIDDDTSVEMKIDLIYKDPPTGSVGASKDRFHIVGLFDYLHVPAIENKAILDVDFFRRNWSMKYGQQPESGYTYYPLSKPGKMMLTKIPHGEDFRQMVMAAKSRLAAICKSIDHNIYYCRPTSYCGYCRYKHLCSLG